MAGSVVRFFRSRAITAMSAITAIAYSLLSASIGLIEAARRAGSQAARPATASMIAAHENRTSGSAGRGPYNILAVDPGQHTGPNPPKHRPTRPPFRAASDTAQLH